MGIRTGSVALAVSLAALVAAGCDKKSEGASEANATPPPAASGHDAHPASAHPTTSAGAHPAASGTAHAGGGEPGTTTGGDLKTLFAGPPDPGVKDSETIVGTQGTVLGFPAKWTSGNVYDTETAFESAKPGPSQQGVSIHCAKADAKLDKTALHSLVFAAMAQKEKWTDEVEGTVGVDKVPASIGRGTGEAVSGRHEPVDVVYVHTTKIAGSTPVLCAASVPQSQPLLFKELQQAFKGMKNTKAKK